MSEWYEDFFRGLALELWRKAVTPELTRAECDFLAAELPSGALLDVPCGNGRHAIELARRGRQVTGVDISAEFIAEAQAAAGALGGDGRVEFVRGDMSELPSLGGFGGAYCMGNSFGYLSHERTGAFLAGVARALAPGGRFVLHTGTAAECLLPSLVEEREMQVGDVHMRSVHHYDAAASTLTTEYTFTRGHEAQTGAARYQVYTTAEIVRMLGAAGLHVQTLYGSPARAPFALRSPMLLLVTQKA
jgi:SAM-dependent methyltransferase